MVKINNVQIDYSQIIIETINQIFSTLFSSLDTSLYSILDKTVFVNGSIVSDSLFSSLFNPKFGLPAIANSILIGICMYYCFKLYMAPFSGNYVERPYQFLLKILIITISVNFSLFICQEILEIASLVTEAMRSLGSSLLNQEISFQTLISNSSYITDSTEVYNIFSFDGLLKSFFTCGLINLLFTYSIRYILIKILVLLSPFAILSLVTNSTSWLFKSWVRAFFSLLFIQIFIILILILLFYLNISSSNNFTRISYVSTIFILTKATSYVRELIGGISTDINANLFNLKNLLK